MALIVEQHVIADQYPVDTSKAISAGMLVEISAAGVIPCTTSSLNCLGVAGDSSLNAPGNTTAYSDNITIGAMGAETRYTSNRVSDMYDETAASQKITVYNGGGKFYIESTLFDADGANIIANDKLAVSANTAGEWGETADASNLNDFVGMATAAAAGYDSGVPGTDLEIGSMSLGTYVPVVLRI